MSNGNKNDDWLKGMKSLLIITSIISLGLIGFYAFYTRGIISSKQSDWAAFGSFLSGVFSFFGAIGTVGVMVLAIKQFKVQQAQIDDQNKRQDDFESRQQKKWDKENEMLNFQKYQLHYASFEELIKKFGDDNDLKITSINRLYRNIFPNNNFQITELVNDETDVNKGELNKLITLYLDCLMRLKILNKDTEQAILNTSHLINKLLNINFKYQKKLENGDIIFKDTKKNPIFTGLNLHTADNTMLTIGELIRSLQRFSGHTREWQEESDFRYHSIALPQLKNEIKHHFEIFNDEGIYLDTLDLQILAYNLLGEEIQNTIKIVEDDNIFMDYYESIQNRISLHKDTLSKDDYDKFVIALNKLTPAFYAINGWDKH